MHKRIFCIIILLKKYLKGLMNMKRVLKLILLVSSLAMFMQSCDALDEADAEIYEAYKNGTIQQYNKKSKWECPDGTIYRRKGTKWGCFDDNRNWF